MLNQSYSQVFVLNTPKLLAQGTTVDLRVGQVGIFDANTYEATTAPTYAKNKGLIIAQGRPNQPHLALMSGISSESYKTKLIKGKKITSFSGKKASRGKQEVIAVGFDGADVTKTLSVTNQGDVITFYLKLTGLPVSKLYSTQGIIRQYKIDLTCPKGCEDGNCDPISAEKIAELLVNLVNADEKIKMFVKASKLVNYPTTSPSPVTVEFDEYNVTLFDAGTAADETFVGAQYPGVSVKRVSRDGNLSTYKLTQLGSLSAPSAVSNAGLTIVPECTTCPTGYTLNNTGYAHLITRQDSGANVSSTITTDYTATSVTKISGEFGQGNYLVIKGTKITAGVSNDVVKFLSKLKSACTITTPTTTAWTAGDTVHKFAKTQKITLTDDCGATRLTELQNAFPDMGVTLVTGTPTDSCTHIYNGTIYSEIVPVGCSVELAVFKVQNSFNGIKWEDISVDNTIADAIAGVRIEGIFQEKLPNDVIYDYYPVEYDGVHIQGSFYNPDYNASPCEDYWPVTKIQNFEYPHGDGYMVKKAEISSLSYTLQERSLDPAVRDAEGYHTNADVTKYYDEYTIGFEFDYNTLGWSQKYSDNYRLTFYVPEGTGKELENAINSYLTSANISIDPVVL